MGHDPATRHTPGDPVYFEEGKFRPEKTDGTDDPGMVDGIELRPYSKPVRRNRGKFMRESGRDTNRKRNATNVHIVIAGVRAGEKIRDAVEAAGITQKTWDRWKEVDPQLNELVKRAQELGAHALVQQCLEIADDVPQDKEAVMKAKLQVETRLAIVKAWNRNYYGDKVEVEQNTNYTFSVTHAPTVIPPRAEDLVPDYDAIKAMDRDDPSHPDFAGDEQGGSPPSTG